MDATWPVLLIVIAFPLAWFGINSLVMLLLSFAGWSGLAEKYRFNGEMPEPNYRFVTVWTSIFGRYNRGMHISLTPRGLIVRPFILFRVAHPALLLPWEMLKSAKQQTFLFYSFAELKFDDGQRKIEIHAPLRILEDTYVKAKRIA
ncbi:MAG: hypothetical protein JNM27_16965 [Leptospirales bacterium]|nr:hypothetical protein [Leptospirales bacterium]